MGLTSSISTRVFAGLAVLLAAASAPPSAAATDVRYVAADVGLGRAAGVADAGPQKAPNGGAQTVPARIVSLTPSVTETLFALGVGAAVVAVSDYCDYPPEAAALPRVGSFLAPVVERVLSLEPDLVITSPSPGNRTAVLAIERAGAKTAVVSEGSGSLDDVRTSILQTSAAVGREADGRALVERIDARLAAVRAAVAGRSRPSTAVLVGFEPLVLAGPDSYLGQLVDVAGGANVAAALGGKWPRAGWELVLASAPHVVFDLSSPMAGDEKSAAVRWARYADVPAVRDGRIHQEGGEVLLRPGPRVAEAAEMMVRAIHPGAWPPAAEGRTDPGARRERGTAPSGGRGCLTPDDSAKGLARAWARAD